MKFEFELVGAATDEQVVNPHHYSA
ncbi:uncharacterized protein METZ01_LOCUS234522 [marine metagenome]|uniref:Uncharacterized protein n=1 Tax=marine metagenome TaxID=408172 RepID=A0A382H304_9ZZZZ